MRSNRYPVLAVLRHLDLFKAGLRKKITERVFELPGVMSEELTPNGLKCREVMDVVLHLRYVRVNDLSVGFVRPIREKFAHDLSVGFFRDHGRLGMYTELEDPRLPPLYFRVNLLFPEAVCNPPSSIQPISSSLSDPATDLGESGLSYVLSGAIWCLPAFAA